MAIQFVKNIFYKYLKQPDPVTIPAKPEETETMTTPADTLVTQHPDRISQLTGPVYKYLKPMMPYSATPQDLYMAVFYPKARKWDPDTEFSDSVKKVNPGIVKVRDYVDKVEAASKRSRPVLSSMEDTALTNTARSLGLDKDSLYKLINFESGWDPLARNPYSGARGLIQFMPKTAASMGYEIVATAAKFSPLIIAGIIVYFYLKRHGYL